MDGPALRWFACRYHSRVLKGIATHGIRTRTQPFCRINYLLVAWKHGETRDPGFHYPRRTASPLAVADPHRSVATRKFSSARNHNRANVLKNLLTTALIQSKWVNRAVFPPISVVQHIWPSDHCVRRTITSQGGKSTTEFLRKIGRETSNIQNAGQGAPHIDNGNDIENGMIGERIGNGIGQNRPKSASNSNL